MRQHGSVFPLNIYFFLAGFMTANWTVRIPAIKDQVGATSTELGLALLCLSVGGLIAMSQGGRLCLRFGSRRVVIMSATLACVMLPLPGLATQVPMLGAFLAGYGLLYGLVTISLNSAAVEVESAAERPVMSGLHGLFSVGSLSGALVGGLAAAHLSPRIHLALVALAGIAIALGFASTLAKRGPERPARNQRKVAVRVKNDLAGVVRLFAVVAFCTAFAEFANNDWAVLHLGDDLGASPTVAAYGYAAYECAIAIARLTGGRLIRAVGESVVMIGGGVLAAVGIVIASWAALLPGGLGLAFAGYLAVGLGVANLYPIAIARAGAIGGPKAISLVAPMSSIGILIERPLVGFLADQTGLPMALSVVAVLPLTAATIGILLRRHLRSSGAAAAVGASVTPPDEPATPPRSQ